jgi:hypothetical protein
LTVAPCLLADQVNGIALYNKASGTSNYVAVARKGCFLVQSTDVVSGGAVVIFNSGGVANTGTAIGSLLYYGCGIGRSLTAADSGGYALVALNM